jgi:hypothetical protein
VHPKEVQDHAQRYCNEFKTSNVHNIAQLFLCLQQIQGQKDSEVFEFWVLGAISEMVGSSAYVANLHT